MNLELEDRVFAVGGGSSGLGLAVARELVAEGARVLLVGRDLERLERAADELGERALPCAADLADPTDAVRVGGLATALFGGLDGALVNAGGPPPGAALELADDEWLEAFDLMVRGPVAMVRGMAPLLEGVGGSLVFVTSSAVDAPIAGLDAANVLRPATAALVRSLARELAPAIRVNALAPGRFDTERVRRLDARAAEEAGRTLDEHREAAASSIPLGRYGEPAELARAAAFLLSPASSYVTGAILRVDGGAFTTLG